jgi:hypothetical protein
MSNPHAKPPTDCRRVYYIRQQIDDWCRAQIRREPWVPVEPAQPIFISKREALERVGLSFFSIWKMEREGRFPRRFRLGEMADAA